jgi:ribosomal protein L37AE/L43A
MNPTLKKALRDRGMVGTGPGNFQITGYSGEKCPNCKSSLFSRQPNDVYRCFDCDKIFERDGWRGFKEVASVGVQ